MTCGPLGMGWCPVPAALRWEHCDRTLKPLGRLVVANSYEKGTKTGVTRLVPVHPTLRKLLDAWWDSGFAAVFGRDPEPGDLIVPTRGGKMRAASQAQKDFGADLKALGLRHRRGHDLRRAFITLAQVDGARRDLLETVTHGPRGDIMSVYTSFPWEALCAEVAKLKIELRGALLANAEAAQVPETSDPFATGLLQGPETAVISGPWEATPTGFEPVSPA